jgi:cell division protein FtsZ
VPAPTEPRPGAGTTNSARPQPGDPVRTVNQPGQQSPHTPASPTTQHSWPTNGPSNSNSSGSQSGTSSQGTPNRPARKPEPEEDLDIPDFLK